MEEKNYFAWLSIDDGKPVKFAELADMMAKALHPSDDEWMDYGVARVNLEQELPQAVQRGELVVRNPAGLGRHTFPVGQSLKSSVVLPQDLIPFLGARSIGLRIVKQQAEARSIDWEYWRAMRKAKEWQACALSLGLDPDSMKGHPQAWMAGPGSGQLFTSDSFPSTDAQVKFEKRLRLLRANRYDRAVFTPPLTQYSSLGPDEVLLSEFAAWGQSVGWPDMPPELVEMAKPVALPRSTKEAKPFAPKTRIEPQGGDSLTPTIWTICYDLRDAGKKVTAGPVMAELKRMATQKIHPLTCTTAGGVKYEYEKGDEQELTAPQLDKRVQEWRKVGG
ncbi:hypothetical protein SAMN06265795_102300 [Noviherbaspirillum humi]|uniref:Uncharacterized protein n=1 Tax=Noviherbaspirillum humi TaxID=1688639 RepID=A0A239DP40_9BURK|nr:hypothetical protein [Noviherbaspirillum humi]SNS34276.1 hypothetical protein SAMN06265795_102300 [Noviherbaspirillum humi]